MKLLVTSAHPTLQPYAQEHLGRLIQPRHYSSIEATAHSGMPWAADNDAFGNWNPEAFSKMLDRIKGLAGCLFVCCPDVVGDWKETAHLFELWQPALRRRGLPVALVAQDGLVPSMIPWYRIDALFIGGNDLWKMSQEAELLVRHAQNRDKWVHFGRASSLRRLRYAYSLGCDSADGSKYARYRDTYLPDALAFLAAGQQLPLGMEEECEQDLLRLSDS